MSLRPQCDLFLTGGRIFGGSGWGVPVWHEAVSVDNGVISAVGKKDELAPMKDSAQRMELDNMLVLPGLCDAHLHMAVGGQTLGMVDLGGMNLDDAYQALKKADLASHTNESEWIEAFNWDNAICKLDTAFLERIFPNLLVIIHQRDLHGCLCSNEALRRAELTRRSPDPEGGRIGRFDDGRPNGMLYESAIDQVRRLVPEPTESQLRGFILRAQDYLLNCGLTAVSEVLGKATEDIYRDLDHSGDLLLDVDAWLRIEDWDRKTLPSTVGERFQLRTLKMFLDGSFGSMTAALDGPYENNPDNAGILFYEDDELAGLLKDAADLGWGVAMHAIGDRALRQVCRVISSLDVKSNRHFRIEHAQLVPSDMITGMASEGIIASVQPVHLLDDQNWLPGRIGSERCRDSFVWKSFLEAGVPLAFGSDWPVAVPDPCLNIHTAINRCGYNSQPLREFATGEELDPVQAIRSATFGWAVAARKNEYRGSIEPGQAADFTVLSGVSDNLRDWSQAKVEMTICGGVIRGN